ncbi:MAG: hypothetical protein AAGB02_09520 [Pseudomonadota bacterium]
MDDNANPETMRDMNDIRKLARIQIIMIVLFFVMKFGRQDILSLTSNNTIETVLYSFPNFAEAIIGTMTVTMVLLVARRNISFIRDRLGDAGLYASAVLIAAVYVISQEFNLHALGGNNLYDGNDVLFSLIGLAVAWIALLIIRPDYPRTH